MKKLKFTTIAVLTFLIYSVSFAQDAVIQKQKTESNSSLTGDDLLGIKSGADPKNADGRKAGKSRKKGKPVLFVIGDSTVKNGKDNGSNGQWGWGHFLWENFDTTKISIENHALGGRSSRTFITEGLWDKVLEAVQPGDFVLVQFGHNDNGSYNIGRARASIHSNSDKDTTVIMESTGKPETVHSFGWYMRKYANDTKAKKATPILLSHIPRNKFTTKDSVAVIRNTNDFGAWTKEAAQMAKVPYIDLNSLIADKLDKLGKDTIQLMFYGDHTHTSKKGAILNSQTVAEGIRDLKKCKLKKYLLKKK